MTLIECPTKCIILKTIDPHIFISPIFAYICDFFISYHQYLPTFVIFSSPTTNICLHLWFFPNTFLYQRCNTPQRGFIPWLTAQHPKEDLFPGWRHNTHTYKHLGQTPKPLLINGKMTNSCGNYSISPPPPPPPPVYPTTIIYDIHCSRVPTVNK